MSNQFKRTPDPTPEHVRAEVEKLRKKRIKKKLFEQTPFVPADERMPNIKVLPDPYPHPFSEPL